MDRPTCATCPYWKQDVEEPEIGECHRHAPLSVMLPIRGEIPDIYQHSDDPTWSVTDEDDWCGDHPQFPQWIAFGYGTGSVVVLQKGECIE